MNEYDDDCTALMTYAINGIKYVISDYDYEVGKLRLDPETCNDTTDDVHIPGIGNVTDISGGGVEDNIVVHQP